MFYMLLFLQQDRLAILLPHFLPLYTFFDKTNEKPVLSVDIKALSLLKKSHM